MAMDAYIYSPSALAWPGLAWPGFSRELVYAKSSTSVWIASRSRKLSVRSKVAR
jgi:hypothetical protein